MRIPEVRCKDSCRGKSEAAPARRPGYPPAMADNPRTRFPDAVNGPLLAALAEGAGPSRDPPGPWTPGGWTLRTHPDLEEALRGKRKPSTVGYAWGFSVLAGRGGRIFAVARSQSHLSWLLPGEEGRAAAEAAGATPDPGLGQGWWTLDAWRGGKDAILGLTVLAERLSGAPSPPPGSR